MRLFSVLFHVVHREYRVYALLLVIVFIVLFVLSWFLSVSLNTTGLPSR